MGGDLVPSNFPEVDLSLIVPDRIFFLCGFLITLIIFIKEYLDLLGEFTMRFPRTLLTMFFLGAYSFVYVTLAMAYQLEDEAHSDGVIQMIRSSLLLGCISMAFGPLLLFTPERKIYVKQKIAVAIVRTAHAKETRYTSFVLFCFVTLSQGVVMYSLVVVLDRVFRLPLVDSIGYAICYMLISLFYLLAVYTAMFKKGDSDDVKIRGVSILSNLRKSIPMLNSLWYLYAYVVAFFVTIFGSLAMIIYFFYLDIHHNHSEGAKASAAVFFVLTLISILVSAVFLLVEAFRVKKVIVPDMDMKRSAPEREHDDDLSSSNDSYEAGYAAVLDSEESIGGEGGGKSVKNSEHSHTKRMKRTNSEPALVPEGPEGPEDGDEWNSSPEFSEDELDLVYDPLKAPLRIPSLLRDKDSNVAENEIASPSLISEISADRLHLKKESREKDKKPSTAFIMQGGGGRVKERVDSSRGKKKGKKVAFPETLPSEKKKSEEIDDLDEISAGLPTSNKSVATVRRKEEIKPIVDEPIADRIHIDASSFKKDNWISDGEAIPLRPIGASLSVISQSGPTSHILLPPPPPPPSSEENFVPHHAPKPSPKAPPVQKSSTIQPSPKAGPPKPSPAPLTPSPASPMSLPPAPPGPSKSSEIPMVPLSEDKRVVSGSKSEMKKKAEREDLVPEEQSSDFRFKRSESAGSVSSHDFGVPDTERLISPTLHRPRRSSRLPSRSRSRSPTPDRILTEGEGTHSLKERSEDEEDDSSHVHRLRSSSIESEGHLSDTSTGDILGGCAVNIGSYSPTEAGALAKQYRSVKMRLAKKRFEDQFNVSISIKVRAHDLHGLSILIFLTIGDISSIPEEDYIRLAREVLASIVGEEEASRAHVHSCHQI